MVHDTFRDDAIASQSSVDARERKRRLADKSIPEQDRLDMVLDEHFDTLQQMGMMNSSTAGSFRQVLKAELRIVFSNR
jgi:hypothetical protein